LIISELRGEVNYVAESGNDGKLTRKTPRLAKAEIEYRRGRPTRRGREPEKSAAMLHASRWPEDGCRK
jgi:hypothetical protein